MKQARFRRVRLGSMSIAIAMLVGSSDVVFGQAVADHQPAEAPATQPQAATDKTSQHASSRTAAQPQQMQMGMQPGQWQLMQDGVAFLTFNRQGGPRGETEFISQNWWMGMASRMVGRGMLTLQGMFSLDPATVGAGGYSELFQTGEANDGRPIVDHQHPHDLVMQLAGVWKGPIGTRTNLTVAGAPVGEATLGPVAFMHRPSAAENPASPLSHHFFDSTHIAMGVIAAGGDRGPVFVETSLFRGREPDENRWDIMDPGALDSWAVRGWLRPAVGLDVQASYGFLNEPEELEGGNIRRTTVSASWLREDGHDFNAITVAYGRNDKEGGAANALLAEATRRVGLNSFYGRFETLQVETDLLLTGQVPPEGVEERLDRVTALTIGGVRDFIRTMGWELGLGGNVTLYGVPQALEATHGERPVSFQVFLRVRPPASSMGRMWNMNMTQPMRGHGMPAAGGMQHPAQ